MKHDKMKETTKVQIKEHVDILEIDFKSLPFFLSVITYLHTTKYRTVTDCCIKINRCRDWLI